MPLRPRSICEFPPGRYMTFLDLDRVSATSLAASMRLSSTSAGPADLVAWLMSLADSDSPSARMTEGTASGNVGGWSVAHSRDGEI